jgi:hypothetical protein
VVAPLSSEPPLWKSMVVPRSYSSEQPKRTPLRSTYKPAAANIFLSSTRLASKKRVSVMPQQFAFVPTNGSGVIGSAERQLIRRHCMRQKNKQPNSRRSKREAARVVSQSGVQARNEQKQAFCVPSAPPSDWALFPFPEALDIPSQKLIHECR